MKMKHLGESTEGLFNVGKQESALCCITLGIESI